MKKLFVLTALLLGLSLSSNAQIKKTWDFQGGGLSEETITNLDLDTSNWEKEGTDDNGNTTGWKEAKKHTGPIMANDVVIPELLGIELQNSGLSSSNNIIIRKDRLRINRDKMKFSLPKLANGQVITIVCQSANGTATNRGVKASYDYMKRIEGPEDDLIPGPSGQITNKWQVVTDQTDSVDIEFTMITGGIDFRLIQIDEGDVPQIAKVALLSANGGDGDVLAILKSRENTEVDAINVDDIPTDYMEAYNYANKLQETYDVVVIGASVPADHSASSLAKSALPYMPVLNLNANIYTAWGYLYGEPSPSAPFARVTNKKHNLFKGISAEEFIEQDGITAVPISNGGAETIAGVKLGSYFDGDDIPAAGMDDDETAIIHTHNINHNGYVYFPYVSDYTPAAAKILTNAITILANSKAPTTAAPAPIISREYKNNATVVTITPSRNLPKTRLFYTLDGSEPGLLSTQYTEPITITEPCTIMAVADAEGYNKSAVAQLAIKIKQQPKTPVITWEEQEGKSLVTVTCATDKVQVWYNFSNTTDTTKSTKYEAPFEVDMPATMTAFAVDTLERGDEVWSEKAERRVLVRNPRIVIDVAAHFRAAKWDGKDNGKGVFSWGQSARSMYTDEGTPTITVDPETGDEIEVIVHDPAAIAEEEVVDEPGDDPQWTLKSRGTCLIWQNTTAQTTNFGQDSNYNPEASTDVDPLFPITSYDIQFYKFMANEPGNASIETKGKYQAPLDVVVLANMAGGPLLVQTSADGQQWTTIGEIAKTGHSRMWNKSTVSYNGTDEVFVRVTEEAASGGPKVFDIYIANAGEQSRALLDELNAEYAAGIEDVQKAPVRAMKGIYNLSGVRQSKLQRGLNIVVTDDGKARKVHVK